MTDCVELVETSPGAGHRQKAGRSAAGADGGSGECRGDRRLGGLFW